METNKNWVKELYSIPTWKKYSQCNEESYVQHILSQLPKTNFLVDIGAGDGYNLSNSRYFIEQGYNSILIDGDSRGCKDVVQRFITAENINDILASLKCPNSFDFLSFDLDGNDIYVLEKILCNYKPSLVVCEFNPIFEMGVSKAITYNPTHIWGNDDYYGFSFSAGVKMFAKYQYTCIFQNDNLNMYFVENTLLAKSLGCAIEEISEHIPVIQYDVMHGHRASVKTGWINY